MPGQTQNTSDIAKRMFKHACAFVDCTYFCHTEIPGLKYRMTQTLGIPDIVLSCFACEVYLKSLLIINGETVEEVKDLKHHIKSLWEKFEQLDPVSAQDFLNSISQDYSQQEFYFNMGIIDNNFQDVRYLYENVSVVHSNRLYLLHLCNKLRNFCCLKIYGCSWSDFVNNGSNW